MATCKRLYANAKKQKKLYLKTKKEIDELDVDLSVIELQIDVANARFVDCINYHTRGYRGRLLPKKIIQKIYKCQIEPLDTENELKRQRDKLRKKMKTLDEKREKERRKFWKAYCTYRDRCGVTL